MTITTVTDPTQIVDRVRDYVGRHLTFGALTPLQLETQMMHWYGIPGEQTRQAMKTLVDGERIADVTNDGYGGVLYIRHDVQRS